MAVQTYTPHELLHLQKAPIGKELYGQLQAKLRQDQELGEVLRLPLERSLPQIMEEPTNISGGAENASPRRGEGARQLDGTESEWRYRGRTDSDAIGAQPISAPTGLAAQKDEGFQRFYRAVVSPTHVRVTAGGRIVPNTRGSPSPTTRWPREKSTIEAATNNSRQPGREPLQQGQFAMPQPIGFFPPHAMIPGFAPGMVPMPTGPAPYPIMPWHVGFNIGGAIGMAPHPMGHVQGLVAMPPPPPNSANNDRQSETGASENATPTRVVASDHCDPTRPHIHNGQWMVPPGSTFHPYALGSHHGFLGPPMLPPMAAGQRFIPSHIMAPVPQGNGQIPQAQAAGVPLPLQQYPTVPNLTLSAGQHQSSIRASQITKRQLSVLRASLKWTEDQLQYNKHQIDERTMELHAQSLRHSIDHFEKIQDEQAANEDRCLAKDQSQDDLSDSASADEDRSKSPVTNSSAKPENSADSFSSLPDEASIVRADKGKPNGQRIAFPSNHDGATMQATPNVQSMGVPDETAAGKKSSTLPVTAALAPPFQPRVIGNQYSSDELPRSVNMQPMHEENVSPQPYLVGELPLGMNAEQARDTDYVYPRQLTEDELRARHMYWGKAPHHLQSGLPKFDGKDFYPPSPDSSQSPDNDSDLNRKFDTVMAKVIETESGGRNGGTEADPFQSSRRTPHTFGRGGKGASTESGSSQKSTAPSQDSDMLVVRRSRQDSGKKVLNGSRHQTTVADSPNARSESDSPDENDVKNIVFKGRNSLRQARPSPRSGIWHEMMKRGTSSGNAVPGTVSSTTAQGVLPHYSGHATASLAPTATNINSAPREQATKSGNSNEGGSTNSAVERQIENRPPGDGKLNAYLGVQGSKKRPSVI
ncbi:hypothetical protein M441DRAFT_30710 [Trichoderma asperellum CBS 433.97]|uniref:Uncharacterized protein n=1 Tax=Trichoderma asperellum (strain ATCC 204424 / CBS 433.97 / NBRC 101777) TaxID=1042311 RepID=A0A2T3YW84_TRIA4|nr:hypothetical protein M441DRAFT_30710 [Trichoderma asperellum CBS 433.97]PTB36787.1 hypothetical protein M441DRAFT_30710 [Trichoderma asperellum CBS 433.97]